MSNSRKKQKNKDQIPSGCPRKNSSQKYIRDILEPPTESFAKMVSRVKKAVAENSARKIYIIVIPTSNENNQEISYGLRDRLASKPNCLLVAPKLDENEPPQALSINELNQLTAIDFPGDETVIYLSGHANNHVFSHHTTTQLINVLKPFLEQTGIKNIKLAGCDSACSYYEEDCEGHNKQSELVTSYAKRFSEELSNEKNKIRNVNVYGYRAEIQDTKNKIRHKNSSPKTHCYADFFSAESINSNKKVRASEIRVMYRDGKLLSDSQLKEDMFENKTTGNEGVFRRITYNKN